MESFNQFISFLILVLNYTKTIEFLFLLAILIIFYHILAFLIRDLQIINSFKKNPDPKEILVSDLKYLPLVNLIIPAWKEGELFRECLNSIIKLKYPKIRVIVNAGGNDLTIEIANSFKKYDNFVILYQKRKERKLTRVKGKVGATNECLGHINEGIIFFIDADCYITDECILRMIYPIINSNENVVCGAGIKPLKSIDHIDLARYSEINTFGRWKFRRYSNYLIAGANTCINYDVIKNIGKFNEKSVVATDISMAEDMISKGYNIYSLNDYRSAIYSDFPKSIYEFFEQRKRYVQNALLYSIKNKNLIGILKYLALFLLSLFVLLSPILFFFHIGLFLIGIYIIFFFYLRKIRRYLTFRILVNKNYYSKLHKILFLKIFFYIYIEFLINFISLFGLISLKKTIKKSRNN